MSVQSSLQIPHGVALTNPGDLDPYYGPWASTAIACSNVDVALRPYKTVGILVSGSVIEYWWPTTSAVADTDLIVKQVPLPQPLGSGDSPTFNRVTMSGATITGNLPLIVTKQTLDSDAPIQANQTNVPDATAITVLQMGITNADNIKKTLRFRSASLYSGQTAADYAYDLPDGGGTLAVLSDITTANAAKVDKITGKGLSTEDYTTAEKTKLAGLTKHYQGKYASISALQTAIPTGSDGDYAIVTGSPNDQEYIWDSDHTAWVLTANIPASTFAALGGSATDNASLSSELTARDTAISNEATARASADTTLQNNINTNTAAIAAEATARAAADTTLQTNIDAKADKLIAFNDQTGTAYTLALTDAGKKVRISNSAANTVTIPLNSSVAFPIGTMIRVAMGGTGNTTIAPASGVTLKGATKIIDVQDNEALLFKEDTDTWKVIGIAPDVSALDGPLAYIKRAGALNTVAFANTVNSVGGTSNGIIQTSDSTYLSGPETGLPTGSSISLTVSLWFKTSTVKSYNCIMSYGGLGSGGLTIMLFGTKNVAVNFGFSTAINAAVTTGAFNDGNKHNVIVTISGNSVNCYYDGSPVSLGTIGSAYNITLNGALNTAGLGVIAGTIDQLAIWNRVITSTEAAQVYNLGAGTSSIPTSGLIRHYEFEEGSGATTADTNPNGTQYSLGLVSGASWAGVGNGFIPLAGSTSELVYFSQSDGVYSGESSTVGVGDVLSGNDRYGKNIRNIINGIATYVNTSAGHFFSKTNTNKTKASASCVDVDANMTIGSTYAGTNAAPANGLLVQGRTLMGTIIDDLSSILQLAGNLYLSLGSKIKIATGTNASIGTATLVAGTVTISTTAVAASSIIMYCRKTIGGTVGNMSIGTVTAGTSFVLNSDNASDTSVINWWIIN